MNTYTRFLEIIKNNLKRKLYSEQAKKHILEQISRKYLDWETFDSLSCVEEENIMQSVSRGNCFGNEDGFDKLNNIPRNSRVTMLRDLYKKAKPVFSKREQINNPANEKGMYGRTPLLQAIVNDDLKQIEHLLNSGANPYIKDNNGHTALILAKLHALEDVVGLLDDYGVKD